MLNIRHMIKRLRGCRVAALALTALLLTGASTAAAAGKKDKSKTTPADTTQRMLSEQDRQRYKYYFLEAVNQQANGNLSGAFDLFRHARDIDPQAAETYYNLAGYYVTMRDDTMARRNFEEAARLNPENTTYLEKLGQFYINSQDYPKAIGAYERLYAINRNSPDIIQIMFQLYGSQNQYDKMIEMLDRLETIEGSNERISLTKMQVYEQQGKKKEQEKELESLIAKHPNDLLYKIMYGNWLLQNDKANMAYKQFTSVLKEDPENTAAQLSLLDYYHAKGQAKAEQQLLRKLLVNKNTPSQTKLTMLQQFIMENEKSKGDSAAVFSLIDDVLAEPQEKADIYLLRAAYMSLKGMPKADIDSVYVAALGVEPDNARARLLLVQDTWNNNDYDRVIELCRPGQEYNPDDMAFYYFQGMAHYMKKENEPALTVFRKGVAQINKDSDPDIVSDFYAIMGDILHEKGMNEEAFVAYDSCLQWKADNIGCLNNYAYYLSELGRELDKAERMSYKTIQAQPKNATFLDTYAWILFQQERYEDARKYIDQAIANDSALGGVVIEHAGDIYAMTGETDKALEFWRQAAEKGNESAVLQKKIKLKKYVKE